MNHLNQVPNQELLKELKNRLDHDQISPQELTKILKEKKYRQGCRLASSDKQRDKEIAE